MADQSDTIEWNCSVKWIGVFSVMGNSFLLISLHILSVMHQQARLPKHMLPEIFVLEHPPPENWNLGRSWHFGFDFPEHPPPRYITTISGGCSMSRLMAVSPKDTISLPHCIKATRCLDESPTCIVLHTFQEWPNRNWRTQRWPTPIFYLLPTLLFPTHEHLNWILSVICITRKLLGLSIFLHSPPFPTAAWSFSKINLPE